MFSTAIPSVFCVYPFDPFVSTKYIDEMMMISEIVRRAKPNWITRNRWRKHRINNANNNRNNCCCCAGDANEKVFRYDFDGDETDGVENIWLFNLFSLIAVLCIRTRNNDEINIFITLISGRPLPQLFSCGCIAAILLGLLLQITFNNTLLPDKTIYIYIRIYTLPAIILRPVHPFHPAYDTSVKTFRFDLCIIVFVSSPKSRKVLSVQSPLIFDNYAC